MTATGRPARGLRGRRPPAGPWPDPRPRRRTRLSQHVAGAVDRPDRPAQRCDQTVLSCTRAVGASAPGWLRTVIPLRRGPERRGGEPAVALAVGPADRRGRRGVVDQLSNEQAERLTTPATRSRCTPPSFRASNGTTAP